MNLFTLINHAKLVKNIIKKKKTVPWKTITIKNFKRAPKVWSIKAVMDKRVHRQPTEWEKTFVKDSSDVLLIFRISKELKNPTFENTFFSKNGVK